MQGFAISMLFGSVPLTNRKPVVARASVRVFSALVELLRRDLQFGPIVGQVGSYAKEFSCPIVDKCLGIGIRQFGRLLRIVGQFAVTSRVLIIAGCAPKPQTKRN